MTWCTTELGVGEDDRSVHVHPAYEVGHILGPWCWCDPKVEEEDGGALYNHRDFLQRTTLLPGET